MPPSDPRFQTDPNGQSFPAGGRQSPLSDHPHIPSSPQSHGPASDLTILPNPLDQSHHEPTSHQSLSTAGGESLPPHLPSPQLSSPMYTQPPGPSAASSDLTNPDIPPLRPVFGVSLDNLLKRDGSAIPLVVYQCLQAVELFGLDVEGIYRLSGSAPHVSKLRAIFDNGVSKWLEPKYTVD